MVRPPRTTRTLRSEPERRTPPAWASAELMSLSDVRLYWPGCTTSPPTNTVTARTAPSDTNTSVPSIVRRVAACRSRRTDASERPAAGIGGSEPTTMLPSRATRTVWLSLVAPWNWTTMLSPAPTT